MHLCLDLQFVTRRHRGEGRSESRSQDHRDQRTECGGRPSREDRQPPGNQCGRGETNKQIFRIDINRRIIVRRIYFYFVPSRIGWVADCLLVSDPHEDNANLHVQTPDWSGESSLHIMCRALLLTKGSLPKKKKSGIFGNFPYFGQTPPPWNQGKSNEKWKKFSLHFSTNQPILLSSFKKVGKMTFF